MALFTVVQHLCPFSIVASLIYYLLPNIWKTSYIICTPIFVVVPYLPPYSTDMFISYVVSDPSQVFFHFDEEIVIAWTQEKTTEPHHSS